MKIPQYTKYSGISITLSGTKSSTRNREKEFLEVAYRFATESDGKLILQFIKELGAVREIL